MANVKENITAQESAYDKDGCIDLILFEEKEHECEEKENSNKITLTCIQ